MITIKTVPQSEQPFNEVGDWHRQGEDTLIRISDMGNPLYEKFIAVHELVEDILVRIAGISEETVNAFCEICESEVGSDDPKSPIHKQHMRATIIEMLVCDWCGVDWIEYDSFVIKYIREKT